MTHLFWPMLIRPSTAELKLWHAKILSLSSVFLGLRANIAPVKMSLFCLTWKDVRIRGCHAELQPRHRYHAMQMGKYADCKNPHHHFARLWEYIGRVGQPVTSPLLNRERTGPGRGGTVPILLRSKLLPVLARGSIARRRLE